MIFLLTIVCTLILVTLFFNRVGSLEKKVKADAEKLVNDPAVEVFSEYGN